MSVPGNLHRVAARDSARRFGPGMAGNRSSSYQGTTRSSDVNSNERSCLLRVRRLGMLAYGALGGGLLTGKYRRGEPPRMGHGRQAKG